MWKNYLNTAWRSLRRDRLYTVINLVGLTGGLISFLFIALYIRDELSYDRYRANADRTYRLWDILDFEGTGEESSSMQFPVTPALLNDYPHLIDDVARFFNFQRPIFTMQVEDQKFNEEGIFFADSGELEVFDWPLISGDPEVMGQPNQLVINENLALKYFGDEDPIGQDVIIEGGIQLKVAGVMKNAPAQSHFRPQALISFITLRNFMGNPIGGNNRVWNPGWTYVMLKDGVEPQELEGQFPEFVEKYYPDHGGANELLFDASARYSPRIAPRVRDQAESRAVVPLYSGCYRTDHFSHCSDQLHQLGHGTEHAART